MKASASRALSPHTSSPPGRSLRIEASAARTADGSLVCHFVLEGPIADLAVPDVASAPGRRDFLWKHTCFEAFLAVEGKTAYEELNFSPSGDWAHYAFRSYRERDPGRAPGRAPEVRIERNGSRLALEARFALDSERDGEALQVGLCAVVEEKDGRLSYWALHHPSPQPDFHDASGFRLRLASPKEKSREIA